MEELGSVGTCSDLNSSGHSVESWVGGVTLMNIKKHDLHKSFDLV